MADCFISECVISAEVLRNTKLLSKQSIFFPIFNNFQKTRHIHNFTSILKKIIEQYKYRFRIKKNHNLTVLTTLVSNLPTYYLLIIERTRTRIKIKSITSKNIAPRSLFLVLFTTLHGSKHNQIKIYLILRSI